MFDNKLNLQDKKIEVNLIEFCEQFFSVKSNWYSHDLGIHWEWENESQTS